MSTLSPLFLALAVAMPSTAEAGEITELAGVFDPSAEWVVEPKPRPVETVPIVAVSIPGGETAIQRVEPYLAASRDPTFAEAGLDVGNIGPDLEMVTLDGDVVRMSDHADSDRPTLFVSVSMTCPIARGHVAATEYLARRHGDRIDVRYVYVVEAHPVVDPSPYTGAEWPSELNDAAGIWYRQPTTMGERVALARGFRDMFEPSAPILVDGPENRWWNTYGPAPNQAVLLAPDGTVLVEHGWLNGDGLDMAADIERVLGLDS